MLFLYGVQSTIFSKDCCHLVRPLLTQLVSCVIFGFGINILILQSKYNHVRINVVSKKNGNVGKQHVTINVALRCVNSTFEE